MLFVSLNLDNEAQNAELDRLRAEFQSRGVVVKDGSWGYRILVIDDPDSNQLYFNYPNTTP